MVHYAGYCPRFHPSDFEQWPIEYPDLKRHYERLELELPVSGDHWPWGDPHGYPHTAHPVTGGAEIAREGARKLGIEMRVGPVGITNGAFGNRPHCIYRGFCLQGCKVNAKASPLVTHLPDAIEHGVEIRADCMVSRVAVDDSSGRAIGVEYFDREGSAFMQRASAVVVAGYSIETPRLLFNSACSRFPHGIGNGSDQLGRCVMVQGAPQVAGRFPMECRMYKAPPPEISSEQFYETDPARGFVRGFSLQTVGPLPIGWAEHVLAAGHLGQALREYMRDYNHWFTLGALSELLPLPENRVTVAADVTDRHGLPVARMDYSQCENDRKNIAYAKETMRRHPRRGRGPGHPRDRPLRPPRWWLPDGVRSRAQRGRRRPPRVGAGEPVHRRWQRDGDAGVGEPGADNHGACLAARRAARRQARQSRRTSAAAALAAVAAAAASPAARRWRLSHAWALRG